MTRKPPTPQDYLALLTERDDLRRAKADAVVLVAELRATVARAKTALADAMTARAEIARELEDTRRVVARQEEELTALRAERAHKDDYAARLASALESAQKRGDAYEAHWRAVARLVGTELEGDYIDAGEAARIAADVEQLAADRDEYARRFHELDTKRGTP